MDILSNSEIRRKARTIIKGKRLDALAVLVIGFFIASSVSFVDSYFETMNEIFGGNYPSLASLASVQNLLLGGPIAMGVSTFFLHISRGNSPEIAHVFKGFKKFTTAFLSYFIRNMFTILWLLLLIVPGVIASLSYSMVFYLLADYSELEPMEALKFSKELMKGHKGRYFLLLLSFAGWFLLGIFTLGLAMIYVIPYQNASISLFYDDLIRSADPELISKYTKN